MTFCRKTFALAACLLWTFAACAFDAYLKIDTVVGESSDTNHVNWIDIESFAQGANQPGKATFSNLCLLKSIDRSSPVLAQSCANGAHFAYAVLEFVTTDASRTRFYQLGLTNVGVTSVSTQGDTGDARPTETLCLTFTSIGWDYTEVDTGGIPVGDLGSWWDLVRNTGGTNSTGSFTVSAAQIDAGTLRLSWPGKSGRTYNILGCPTVTGSYQVIQSLTPSSDGITSVPVGITGGAQFFRVQEAP